MYMFINVYVYVSIVYMLCSPMLEEIKYLSILLGTNVVLIQTMCSDLDPDPHIKGQGHTIHCKMLQIKDSFSFFLSQNNIDIDLTYTTHNLNNFNKYPSITCSYIQE